MTLWTSQWELFAPNFKDGKAHLDLSPYGVHQTLKLLPGPGFGDFSHPTTRLALKLMAQHIPNQHVIDIGCGSGILSLAAAAFGAKSVYGYDIEPEAIVHAKQNAKLNNLPIQFTERPPSQIPPHSSILMNMISSEQAQAWSTFLPSLTTPARLFTSGVLDKEGYLFWAKQNSWTLVQCIEEESWWAFEFSLVLPV